MNAVKSIFRNPPLLTFVLVALVWLVASLTLRGFGAGCSPRTFGHNGAGGQISWADPDTGLSMGFVTSGIDANFLREARRTISIASKVADSVSG